MREQLERRIAAALTGADVTSAQLGNLLTETEAAIGPAQAAVEEAGARLLDPTVVVDAKAKAAAQDAALVVDRLRAALPALQKRCQSTYAAEEMAAYLPKHAAAQARSDELAAALAALYVPFLERAVPLMAAIEKHATQIALMNLNSPSDAPHLRGVEETARVIGSGLSIVRDLKLPAWTSSAVPAWPPNRAIDAILITPVPCVDPRAYGPDWWQVQRAAG